MAARASDPFYLKPGTPATRPREIVEDDVPPLGKLSDLGIKRRDHCLLRRFIYLLIWNSS
jgi:hypothetical protein